MLLDDHLAGLCRAQRHLLEKFGYDPLYRRWWPGAVPPSDTRDWLHFWQAYRVFEDDSCLFLALLDGYRKAQDEGREPFEAAIRQYMDSDRGLVWAVGRDIMLWPWADMGEPDVDAENIVRYVGTLQARTNLNRNRRVLAALLAGGRRRREQALAEELVVEAPEALRDGGPHEHPQTVLNRVLNRIARIPKAIRSRPFDAEKHGQSPRIDPPANPPAVGRPRGEYKTRRNARDGVPAPWPERRPLEPMASILLRAGLPLDIVEEARRRDGLLPPADLLQKLSGQRRTDLLALLTPYRAAEPGVEEFSARQEAQRQLLLQEDAQEHAETLGLLASRAGLSPREAEVIRLVRVDGLTFAAIAARLGIDAGTVRVTHRNAMRKLESLLPRAT